MQSLQHDLEKYIHNAIRDKPFYIVHDHWSESSVSINGVVIVCENKSYLAKLIVSKVDELIDDECHSDEEFFDGDEPEKEAETSEFNLAKTEIDPSLSDGKLRFIADIEKRLQAYSEKEIVKVATFLSPKYSNSVSSIKGAVLRVLDKITTIDIDDDEVETQILMYQLKLEIYGENLRR
uniref:DUF4303 domain-containing protein n=1 Tax=Rhabditophanes sp. KR3021 TaxID=114890 RepID=A0AC35TM76_9BILA